jgi:hypothetical protein
LSGKKALAREILEAALKHCFRGAPPHLRITAPDGSTRPLYSIRRPGVGRLNYDFIPQGLVESIIADCEKLPELQKWPVPQRGEALKKLATHATIRLLIDLPARLSDALQTAYKESLFYMQTAVMGSVAHEMGAVVDTTHDIEEMVGTSAEAQRKRLSENAKRVGRSEVMTPTGDRRVPKITEGRLRLTYQTVKEAKGPGERVEQREVAKKLKVSTKQLRRWCQQRLGLRTWDEVVARIEGT